MWYEVIPSAIIVGYILIIPQYFTYFSNKWDCNDHPHRRNIFMPMVLGSYFRDQRLTGDPYVMKGLESLPDEPTTSTK